MSCRKQRKLNLIGLALGLIVSISLAQAGSEITSIDFNGTADPSEIKVTVSGPFDVETQENTKDNQIILDFKGVSLSRGASKRIDTSSFDSKVSLISPSPLDGQPGTTRVLVQLKEPGNAELAQEGNTVFVRIPRKEAGGPPVEKASEQSVQTPESSPQEAIPASAAPPAIVPPPALVSDSTQPIVKTQGDKLESFLATRDLKKFSGTPISLNVRDVDVTDILRLIGDASGFNIVVGSDVSGKITLSLTDVPWDQALDLVLRTMQLGAERNNNILRISTLKNLTAEKQQELAATQAVQATTPKMTKIFPISYAAIKDLVGVLTKFSSTASTSGTQGVDPAIIQEDTRTNSIVVHDLPQNIERMKKLIQILDTATPQVMIEAKILEVTDQFSKSLGGSLGLGFQGGPGAAFGSFSGADPFNSLVGGAAGGGANPTISAAGTGSLGLSPVLNFISSNLRLNALLNVGENESQAKLLSSPKTVVLNRQKASILESTPVLVPAPQIATSSSTTSGPTVQQANLSLNVTPTVTNDGNILMDLAVSRDVPYPVSTTQNGIANRNISTQVMVEGGTTLMIGGIYTNDKNTSASGFPILRNIPIIGMLFGSETGSDNRSELLIFVTPRVLNAKNIFSGG